MKPSIIGIVLSVLTFSVAADTKHLNCNQINSSGDKLIVNAVIDDQSDMAEVEYFMLDSPCDKSKTCKVEIYAKQGLPSVIRLSKTDRLESKVIDINRTDLSINTRSVLDFMGSKTETLYKGKCSIVKVDSSNKLL
jgi:hypothetical protein